MADLENIAATVQQLLTQTTALLRQNVVTVIQDETLETLERDSRLAMTQLRRLRNESLPIPANRLPPELLQMVFGHLRSARPLHLTRAKYRGPRPAFASYKSLVAVMLVCHKWCAIASNAASLWTEVDFQLRRTFTPVLLTRSSGVAINLRGRLSGEENALEAVIRNNGTRIRDLDICAEKSISALQSILAVNMPRLRVLSLAYKSDTLDSVTMSGAPACFPILKAMLLQHLLFVPAQILPKLTHLRLDYIRRLSVSDLLNLLRSVPSLEVLYIMSSDFTISPNPITVSSAVALPRLQNARIYQMNSTMVFYLMNAIEIPRAAFLDFDVGEATHLSTPLILDALSTRTMPCLALDVSPNFAELEGTLHGRHVSLSMTLRAVYFGAPDEDRTDWAFTGFPTVLPLSGVEEIHILTYDQWDPTSSAFLAQLATHMPALSTLLIKYDAMSCEEEVDGHIELARAVAHVLENDSPVLFPHLAHLDLIVRTIPLAFCEILSRALARRDEDGRRLQRLRICVDHDYSPEWKQKWRGRQEPDYKETGIFDHVDECEICDDSLDHDTDAQRFGWGLWKDCVQHSRHEYWQDSE